MKIDRELLELAARAAGIDITWKEPSCGGGEIAYIGADSYMPIAWMPLSDDGDALRLAVKLREKFGTDIAACFGIARFAEWESDPYASTRRAIVRAAAEIQLQKEREQ